MNYNLITMAGPAALFIISLFSGGSHEEVKPPDNAAQVVQATTPENSSRTCQKDLDGVTVIIDAGHGGDDPGSHTEIWGQKVWEASYTNDVALRLKRTVECRGGTAYLTVDGVQTISNSPANQAIPINRDARFAYDDSHAVAGKRGLTRRLGLIDTVLAERPNDKVVWMSIHFDSAGSGSDINGVHLLIPRAIQSDPLTLALQAELQDEHRERTYEKRGERVESSIVINEDNRNVFVLRASENKLRLRYLVELGNLAQADDSYRARCPEVREEYAQTLADGLARGLNA